MGKPKRINDLCLENVYDDHTYIYYGIIYKFIEGKGCNNCSIVDNTNCCENAPCGQYPRIRKDKKQGAFKHVGDVRGDVNIMTSALFDGIKKTNERLELQVKELEQRKNDSKPRNKRIYLSGPITGLTIEEAKEMFANAERNLKGLGYDVVNPFNNGLTDSDPWIEHVKIDIDMLDPCGCICYLHNCDLIYSSGTEIEKIVARRDKKIEMKEILRDGTYSYILL